jgi:hypothetical protein
MTAQAVPIDLRREMKYALSHTFGQIRLKIWAKCTSGALYLPFRHR